MFGGTSAATTTASSSGFSFCQASGKNLREIFPWLSSVYETFATSLHCLGNEKEVRENKRFWKVCKRAWALAALGVSLV